MSADGLQAKYERLQELVRGYGSLLVAFSGGLDSSLLVRVARDALGDRLLAVTALSPTYPSTEHAAAEALARELGVRLLAVETDELAIAGFAENPPERCYFCKSELFGELRAIARREGIAYVADGTNADDRSDYRPGMQAASELGVVSPLCEAGLTKADIRALSKRLGLPTWDKPSAACLASRFPYGETITREKLAMVEAAEDFLKGLGFRQVRVRHHGTIARIEVAADRSTDDRSGDEIERLASAPVRDQVVHRLTQIGYHYVTVDCRGYRTGSMNEVLAQGGPAGSPIEG
jgi:uncharacterized protein